MSLVLCLQVVVGTVNVFVQERALLIREQAKGLYRVGAYMLAKTVSDMVCYFLGVFLEL